jgi:hypothetical protein
MLRRQRHQQRGREREVHVSIMGHLGTTQRVCCAVGAYVSSHISYSHLAYAGWLCYRSVAHTGPLVYQLWVAGTHPTLRANQVNEVAKHWDSLAGTHVCLGAHSLMYPYGLWPWPTRETDLAREVTVELLPMGQVLLDLC